MDNTEAEENGRTSPENTFFPPGKMFLKIKAMVWDSEHAFKSWSCHGKAVCLCLLSTFLSPSSYTFFKSLIAF